MKIGIYLSGIGICWLANYIQTEGHEATSIRYAGQYECYLDLFRGGVSALENHTATKAERVLKILCRIAHDICEEQHEWEFSALSPAEQAAEIARAAKARKEWDARMRDLKMKRQTCYEEE